MSVDPRSRIAVVPYDASWPDEFERSAARLEATLGANLVKVHHIGSTSLPKIYAKPVIDMLAVVTDLAAVDHRSDAMVALGYQVMGEFGIEGRRYFRRDDASGGRTHQIHTFVDGSSHVRRHLAFRDFMRAHPSLAQQYGELKRALAETHPYDMDAYMDGKDAFIKEIEQQALCWLESFR